MPVIVEGQVAMGRGTDGHTCTLDKNVDRDRSHASGESIHGVPKQIQVYSDPKSEERKHKIVKESRKLLKKTSSKSWVQKLNAFKVQVKKNATSDMEACRLFCIVGRTLVTEGTHRLRQLEALEWYEDASQLDPISLSCAYRYGILLFRSNFIGRTIAVLQNALGKQAPGTSEDGVEEEIPLKARVLVNLGVAHEAQDNFADAIYAYQRAIELHVEYPAALKLLGCVRQPFRSVTEF
jgi:tetratricopeptide (TPR) repeat protein